jgi:tetratricopeptide (TPR) repeat protein
MFPRDLFCACVVAGVLLFPAGSVWADPTQESNPDRLDDALAEPGVATAIMIGRALVESGDFVGALPYYQHAWRADPTHRETGLRLAEVAIDARRPDVALDVLGKLYEQDPTDVAVGARLARLQMRLGSLPKAQALADELYSARPRSIEVLELRLELQRARQDFDGMLRTADELIEVDGENAEWRTRRGEALLRLGREDEAEAEWRRALQLEPGAAEAGARLTDLLVSQNRHDELIEELQRQVDEQIADPGQTAALADLYLESGRLEEAAAVLLPLATSGDLNLQGELLLVRLLGDLDRQQEALELLDGLQEDAPGSAALLALRGELLLDLRDYDAAEQALRSALEVDPSDNEIRVTLLLAMSGRDPELLRADRAEGTEFLSVLEEAADEATLRSLRQNFLVGAMFRRLGRNDEALTHLERAASLPGASEQVLYELAIAQQEAGRARAAAGTLEQLLKLQPDSPEYLNFYGYLLADEGWELPRARKMIERALEADPDNGAYVDSMGWVLYREGQLDEALEELIRAVNLVGDDPIVLEHLGDCLRDLGRIDEARRTYRRALDVGGDVDRLQGRIDALEEPGP